MARYVGGLGRGGWMRLAGGVLIAVSGCVAWCQVGAGGASAAAPSTAAESVAVAQPRPAYEVATVKPWDGKGFAMPLRVYIQIAFDIPPNRMGSVIGPEWIESARYAIQGKPPESVREALRTMTPEEGAKVMRGMAQSLLADRFGLKAHYETREMTEYQLVVAKGGSKLKESADQTKRWIQPGASVIKGNAMPVSALVEALEQVSDIGGRPVVDKTGLSGSYDLLLRWTPMDAAQSADAEGGSLFTALQEQMGLKLVSAKGPVQVLVIDRIERPTDN